MNKDESELSNLDTYSDDQLAAYFDFSDAQIREIRDHAIDMRKIGKNEAGI